MNHLMNGFADELVKVSMSPAAKRALIGAIAGGGTGAAYGNSQSKGDLGATLRYALAGAGVGGAAGQLVTSFKGYKASGDKLEKTRSHWAQQKAKSKRELEEAKKRLADIKKGNGR